MMNTHKERIYAYNESEVLLAAIDKANKILTHVINTWFDRADITSIERDDMEVIGAILNTVSMTLWDASTEWNLETCPDEDNPGVSAYFHHADKYRSNLEISHLHDAIRKETRNLQPETRKQIEDARIKLGDMPDSEALPALHKLLAEAKEVRA